MYFSLSNLHLIGVLFEAGEDLIALCERLLQLLELFAVRVDLLLEHHLSLRQA